ncbi:MAG: NAD-dependent epimerase/dehydratase family protein/3-beta hydroxysteroid dehydrogenase/isomerase family protein [Microgenomates group bacterium Gr01-1014_16]|nr:MAG: NAD-dependent epimerase/dehydratase family protein/3-beta hydroxysteroid dehydrogenase/isomerase family protein [Microgenomates group bacterium Gr01-1014_16]
MPYEVIITGATGFVGQRVIQRIEKYYDKRDILCLTWSRDFANRNRHVENAGRRLLTKLKIKTKDVDLVTRQGLENLPLGVDTVINIAANTNTSDPDHRCNDEGVVNLLDALGNIKPKMHFVQISTVAFMTGRLNCDVGIDENTQPIPTNEYGRTKLRAEDYLIKMCKKKGFKLTIIRLNTVYGSGSRPDSMFDLLDKWVKKDSLITRINWPGMTSIIHVDDAAEAILRLSRMPPVESKYDIFTLYAESLSFSQINREVYKYLGKSYRPLNFPAWFWKCLAFGRRFIPYLESILPASWYNPIWRVGLIEDDVVYCETDKAFKRLPGWKPRKLAANTSQLFF